MGRREHLDDLGIRPDENVCTGCYTVPPDWYRAGDGNERCAECDEPRSQSKPALTLQEERLEEMASG